MADLAGAGKRTKKDATRRQKKKKNERRKGRSEKTSVKKNEMMSKDSKQTECAISLGKYPKMNDARGQTDDQP